MGKMQILKLSLINAWLACKRAAHGILEMGLCEDVCRSKNTVSAL